MKADFEKGTKICSKCKRELSIEMFNKDNSRSDKLSMCCKDCTRIKNKHYNNRNKNKIKFYFDKVQNTFGRTKNLRGHSVILKRDYELTKEQLKKRELQRSNKWYKSKRTNAYGILIWYDGTLNELNSEQYHKIMCKEYTRQRYCAIRGYIGKVKPSEHFLFDFDLEQMLKDNVYCKSGKKQKIHNKMVER